MAKKFGELEPGLQNSINAIVNAKSLYERNVAFMLEHALRSADFRNLPKDIQGLMAEMLEKSTAGWGLGEFGDKASDLKSKLAAYKLQ